ncbi:MULTISPECIES: hypothetical protein [Persicobacter]|uniref:Uncharacterized protein n=1 Tax=Persicobacter diffluens TaxID=981 RepID=A0AAN4VXX4_9BACT|nr:hypothetical protein [Persicobacter sp. CCB-QB2]GJM61279.1 hypothetical protein PEDI_18310 [Persicobacter diffluens]
MGISTINVRVGKNYQLTNFGEKLQFQVLEIFSNTDFLCKDLNTMEEYHFEELVAYGKGNDYELEEL